MLGLQDTVALPISQQLCQQGHPVTAQKAFALGSPTAQDNCLATHPRNGTWNWDWPLYSFVCWKGSQRNNHLKQLHHSAAWRVLPSQVGFLLGRAVTHQPPLQIFLFDQNTLLK